MRLFRARGFGGVREGLAPAKTLLFRPVGAILAIFCLFAPAARSQSSRPPDPPPSAVPAQDATFDIRFRSRTTLIQVPVIVTGKGNIHLNGLTRDQFRVFENGQEKQIASFEEIHLLNYAAPASAPVNGAFTNIHVGDPQMITVIALDMVNTPHPDQMATRAALVRYLADNLSANQRIALVSITSHGLGIISDVDSDPQSLIRALQRTSAGVPAGSAASSSHTRVMAAEDQFNAARTPAAGTVDSRLEDFMRTAEAPVATAESNRAIETTLRAFQGIAWSLSGIPGRKVLVWASGGMPLVRYSMDGSMPGYLEVLYEKAIQSLNDAQVAVYPVDVTGLIGGSPPPIARGNPPAVSTMRLPGSSWRPPSMSR